jgi:hypothetical protein
VQGSAGIADQWEKVFTVPSEQVKLTQYFKSLAREGGQVLDARLHTSGWNPPAALLLEEQLWELPG